MVAYVLKSFSILRAGVYRGPHIQLVQDFVHQLDRVKQLVGDAVFKNLAMRVKLDKKPEADTPVDAFISELRKIPCLHFAPIPDDDDGEDKK